MARCAVNADGVDDTGLSEKAQKDIDALFIEEFGEEAGDGK